jgi:serine phosphatase RsbU (regulator of sigma subunit)
MAGIIGDAGFLFFILANLAGAVLAWRILVAAFRLIRRRLALRLAFSYFLIGILPIPLLVALFSAFAYLLCHQIIAARLHNEVATMVELARSSSAALPRVRISPQGAVTSSEVSWLAPGDPAPWAKELSEPHPLIVDRQVWLGFQSDARDGSTLRLMPIQDPAAPWLQRLADRTGWDVEVRPGSSRRSDRGFQIRMDSPSAPQADLTFVRPRSAPAEPPKGLWNRMWLAGIYLDRPVAVLGKQTDERTVVVFMARTSPAAFARQLFAQGVPEINRVVRTVLFWVAANLLFVYLVALAVAFVLVGTIVRNVNRLTRATEAVARGDFSVRVNSKSREQIGDLARSFDAMAASIQKLLVETAHKEKIEAELAVARAIQESFLPESGASWKGFQAVAHFEPAADLGGDYYDILPMPDGRTAVSIGDVSGHGLPTGLVAAAARASLATFLELGVPPGEAFLRLGRRTERSRASERRLYTTLALFAYDAGRRVGSLTNAGHPAPYRVSGASVERLALPALPIGLLPGRPASFPSQDYAFSPGDRLVFFTDGIVEAADAREDPWGYERLEALLAREGQRSPQELVDAILAAVASHVGDTPLEDDRTLLILTFDAA